MRVRPLVGGIAVAAGAVVAAALLVRPDLPEPARLRDPGPGPAPTPAGAGLTPEGLGPVRFGLDVWGLRRAVCGRTCDVDEVTSATGTAGCEIYSWGGTRGDSPPAATGWAWMRDGSVVAVGVRSDGDPLVRTATWTGLRLGDPLSPGGSDGWEWQAGAAVPIAQVTDAGVTTTLADTDGNGDLDYARVATAGADGCGLGPGAQGPAPQAPGPQAALVAAAPDGGFSYAGIVLGGPLAEADVPDGWDTRQPQDWDAVAVTWYDPAGGGAVTVCRGVVSSLDAPGVVAGPVAGDDLTTARKWLSARGASIAADAAGPDQGRFVTVSGTDPTGIPITFTALAPAITAGLDVVLPAPQGPADALVSSVTVGAPCPGDPYDGAG